MKYRKIKRLMTFKEVMELSQIKSRTTIYRRVKAGTFPAPVAIGHGQIRWRDCDYDAWSESLPSVG